MRRLEGMHQPQHEAGQRLTPTVYGTATRRTAIATAVATMKSNMKIVCRLYARVRKVDCVHTGCSATRSQGRTARVFQSDAEDADRSNRHRKRKPDDRTLHKMHDIHVIGSPDIARILSCSSTYIHDAHDDGIDRGLFLAIFARNTRPREGSSGIQELCAGLETWF